MGVREKDGVRERGYGGPAARNDACLWCVGNVRDGEIGAEAVAFVESDSEGEGPAGESWTRQQIAHPRASGSRLGVGKERTHGLEIDDNGLHAFGWDGGGGVEQRDGLPGDDGGSLKHRDAPAVRNVGGGVFRQLADTRFGIAAGGREVEQEVAVDSVFRRPANQHAHGSLPVDDLERIDAELRGTCADEHPLGLSGGDVGGGDAVDGGEQGVDAADFGLRDDGGRGRLLGAGGQDHRESGGDREYGIADGG